MTACFLSNISAKYYKNPSMLSRVTAKNVGDVFLRHGKLGVFSAVHRSALTAPFRRVCLSVCPFVCLSVILVSQA